MSCCNHVTDGKLCPGVLSVLVVYKYGNCLFQLMSPLRFPQDVWLWSFNEPFSSILECQVLLTPKRLLIDTRRGGLREGITQVQKTGQDYSPSLVNNLSDCWCNHRMPSHYIMSGNKGIALPRAELIWVNGKQISIFTSAALNWLLLSCYRCLVECLTCYLHRVAFLVCDSTWIVRLNLVLITTDELLLLLGFTEAQCRYTHWEVKTGATLTCQIYNTSGVCCCGCT